MSMLNPHEIEGRLAHYFNPYHEKINQLLIDFKSKFNQAFFWDAHSIRRLVPTIHKKSLSQILLLEITNLHHVISNFQKLRWMN